MFTEEVPHKLSSVQNHCLLKSSLNNILDLSFVKNQKKIKRYF